MKQSKQDRNDLYSLALSLVYDETKAKKLADKAFGKVLSRLFEDERQLKFALYKKLLKSVGRFGVRKKACKDSCCLGLAKKNFKIFDKKVFVLKYEHGFDIAEIAAVLNASEEKVKKALFKTTYAVSQMLEEKDEMC